MVTKLDFKAINELENLQKIRNYRDLTVLDRLKEMDRSELSESTCRKLDGVIGSWDMVLKTADEYCEIAKKNNIFAISVLDSEHYPYNWRGLSGMPKVIYCRGRKVVGILTEAGFSKDDASQGLDYAVVGIGINVWEAEGGFPVEIRDIAGAVFPWEKRPDRREERDRLKAQIIARLLDYFDAIYKQLPEKQFMEIYREKSLLIGKNVMVMSSTHQKLESDPVHVIGVGEGAELIVQDQEGKVTRLFSGEVSVREI